MADSRSQMNSADAEALAAVYRRQALIWLAHGDTTRAQVLDRHASQVAESARGTD
ncbi:hypothetical protein [Mycobacteroides abscessus]|uniref:hypothetical protein n=1 Tax=Mycobacteroides abscessus TaxID=36809 RepID=UPI00092B98ED|nr:hypothetical protein [Mycobacteroides abscessus]SIN48069.1 Uncharacterised protein [Mycobacteroides abscessus subsp. bolletii]SHV73975.1 Uncharacterised protein [Mycobacteroides abscessus subsp. abscessus]SHW32771.1 Uncharacterised protein [Mycobacteroides abscessus subsp. abscessus]SHW39542.1 Uncharacterised protein [Mycobacteroides abscessus subsp. abscessus]SHW67540.1 Uncharacterised protein [Mycobacteroides abscessus subsp. abscessus]